MAAERGSTVTDAFDGALAVACADPADLGCARVIGREPAALPVPVSATVALPEGHTGAAVFAEVSGTGLV